MAQFEVFVSVHEIVEMRDNSVYRTKFLRNEWIDSEKWNHPPEGFVYAVAECPSPEDDPTGMGIRVKKN